MRKFVTLSLSLSPKLKKKLTDVSLKLQVPKSVLIRKALADYMASNPKKSDFKAEY